VSPRRFARAATLVVVEVANAWMNRLIAEARHPTGEIFGPADLRAYDP